ncbi:type II secretion system protein [bacterium]|nr:MAG: type II secretion system protein [bacterium]
MVNCKLKIAKRKGFTLIELMVVIAIIGILAATVLVNFGRNPDRDVRLEADRLVTFIRSVQNKALSAEKVPGSSGKVCGFGVHLSGSALQVYYVQTSGLSAQDVDCASLAGADGSDYAGNTFYPGNGVTVSLPNSTDKIFFLIPNGNIYYNGSSSSSDININLTKTGLSSPISVTITPGGIIK